MKPFYFHREKKRSQGGFSLVEAALSIGIFGFGFLTLAPLLVLGSKSARQGRDSREAALIAQSMMEEARQGTLSTGTTYLDSQGDTCSAAGAAYQVKTDSQILATDTATVSSIGAPTRVTIKVTPLGAPDRAQTYAVVFPATQ